MINWFETAPRRVLALICAGCVAALAFGLYLQHVVGLEPCPMCIVQRYAMLLVGLLAGLTALSRNRGVLLGGSSLVLLAAGFGAFTAARQSWLQWYPPEVASCGRDFYGMIETFPLQRVIPDDLQGQRRLQQDRLDLPRRLAGQLVVRGLLRLDRPRLDADRQARPAAQRQPALVRLRPFAAQAASTACSTLPKNSFACAEFNQRTTTTSRRSGSMKVNELPAPIAK